MKHRDQEYLNRKIDKMRKKLIQIAAEKGLNNSDTIRYSQALDKLITLYFQSSATE